VDSILQNKAEVDEEQEVLYNYVNSSAKALAKKFGTGASSRTEALESIPVVNSFDSESAVDEPVDLFYGSFDEWLASFTPVTMDLLDTPTQRLEHVRKQREKITMSGTLYIWRIISQWSCVWLDLNCRLEAF
jgi:hypothetical protein